MTAKFQLYDEEAEIQLGPQGEIFRRHGLQ